MNLLDIFVLALKHMKNDILGRLTVTRDDPKRAEDITWVLTVPVCCSEAAKCFMRKAAIQAGFITGGDDDQALVLCMEPVAACLALGPESLPWRTNDKYLVIDCGGGTVDISAFKLVNAIPARLEQVGMAIGGEWGSINVDAQFEGYLRSLLLSVAPDVGVQGVESFLSSSSMYRIMQSWESAKVGLESVNHACRVDLGELSDDPLEVTMENLNNGRRQLMSEGAQEDGTWDLVLRPATLRTFFQPQCAMIAQAVLSELERPHLQGLTSVVLVGGFSGSVHVQEAVRACVLQKYPDNSVDVRVANNPDLAIVQGAGRYVDLQRESVQRQPVRPTDIFSPYPVVASAPQYPTQYPVFGGIVAHNSYGIQSYRKESRRNEVMFDAFFIKGQTYEPGERVQRQYTVTSGKPFSMRITSCPMASVRDGLQTLNDLGGERNIETLQVEVVPPPPQTSAIRLRQVFRREKTHISVEFTIIGIDLRVKVNSEGGELLFERFVPFASSRSAN